MSRKKFLQYCFALVLALFMLVYVVKILEDGQETRLYERVSKSQSYEKQVKPAVTRHEPKPFDRSQIYENLFVGLRIGIPAEWRVIETGFFDGKTAFIQFQDGTMPPSVMHDLLMTIEPASDKPLPCTIPDLLNEKYDLQLVKTDDGEAFLSGPTTGEVFGFVSRKGESYSFCANRNGFHYLLQAMYDEGTYEWDDFLSVLLGMDFMQPTRTIEAQSDTIADPFCGMTWHVTSAWIFKKNGACLDSMVRGFSTDDSLASPEGDIHFTIQTYDLLDPDAHEMKEEFTISGYLAQVYMMPSPGPEFDFGDYLIAIRHPKLAHRIYVNMKNPQDPMSYERMIKVVKAMEIQ